MPSHSKFAGKFSIFQKITIVLIGLSVFPILAIMYVSYESSKEGIYRQNMEEGAYFFNYVRNLVKPYFFKNKPPSETAKRLLDYQSMMNQGAKIDILENTENIFRIRISRMKLITCQSMLVVNLENPDIRVDIENPDIRSNIQVVELPSDPSLNIIRYSIPITEYRINGHRHVTPPSFETVKKECKAIPTGQNLATMELTFNFRQARRIDPEKR